MTKRIVYQDGGQFYDDATGEVVADYGDTGSLEVAESNRERFTREHPECGFAPDYDADPDNDLNPDHRDREDETQGFSL